VDDAEDAEVILHEYGHAIHFSQSPTFYSSLEAGARVHADGRIWSRALWDIRNALGNVVADTVILEAQFDFPGTTMPDLARATVATAQRLYGTPTATAVRAAFQARGIL